LPRDAAAPERHALLDHLDDVRLRFQVGDEGGGKERHQSFNSTTVTPPPPWFAGAGAKLSTNGCDCRNVVSARRSWPVPYPCMRRTDFSSLTSASSRNFSVRLSASST